MAVPCIVVIFELELACSSIIRFRELRRSSFGNEPPATKYRTMKMKYFLTALLVSSLATPATVQAGTHESSTPPPLTSRFAGREVAAPPSSAACMTDHGPSECDELM
jgi:hypothetical protein